MSTSIVREYVLALAVAAGLAVELAVLAACIIRRKYSRLPRCPQVAAATTRRWPICEFTILGMAGVILVLFLPTAFRGHDHFTWLDATVTFLLWTVLYAGIMRRSLARDWAQYSHPLKPE
jgi:hypothetical protein